MTTLFKGRSVRNDRTVHEVTEKLEQNMGREVFGAIISFVRGGDPVYEFRVHPEHEVPITDMNGELIVQIGKGPISAVREEARNAATKLGLPRVVGLD